MYMYLCRWEKLGTTVVHVHVLLAGFDRLETRVKERLAEMLVSFFFTLLLVVFTAVCLDHKIVRVTGQSLGPFWGAGKQTITQSNFAETVTLRIKFVDVLFLNLVDTSGSLRKTIRLNAITGWLSSRGSTSQGLL